jgi:lysine 2,3-aminomutase
MNTPEIRKKAKYIRRVEQVEQLSGEEKTRVSAVVDKYVFRANDYYLGLIDWNDPEDPIRKIIIPREDELLEFGQLDASDEASNYAAPHVQHKYFNTALMMVSEVCGAYCRFCFRKRLFMDEVHETSLDISEGLAYIREHPEIDNVLMTGGDPLMISAKKLDKMFDEVFSIPHVKIIRVGTKIPAFDPMRISRSSELLSSIKRHSKGEQQIYLIMHFNHPREVTPEAMHAIGAVREHGGLMVAQTPLLGGVNDDPAVLTELFNRLSYLGVPPYYLFQGRPTEGNEGFKVELDRGFRVFEEAKVHMSGLARRLRYAMSHAAGKLEVLWVGKNQVILKFHQARDPHNLGRAFVLPMVPGAYWLDDLLEHPRAKDELIRQGIKVAPTGMRWRDFAGAMWEDGGHWSPYRPMQGPQAAR